MKFAFDVCDRVEDFDILRSYVKKFDTQTNVVVVCPTGKVSAIASTLAAEYEIPLIEIGELRSFLSRLVVRPEMAKIRGPAP